MADFYWVKDVDIYGMATMHGPVSADYTVPTAVTTTSEVFRDLGGLSDNSLPLSSLTSPISTISSQTANF